MAENSNIQWTQATWNPWHGCKKVSLGCKFCYMYRDKEMHKQDPTIVLRSKTMFNAPLKWKESKIIFTCSWSDWFIDEADGWRDEAWQIVIATPRHQYQILTKRIERAMKNLPVDKDGMWFVPKNVILGISAENQEEFDGRWPVLEGMHQAHQRFISVEPLLGPIDMRPWLEYSSSPDERDTRLPDWVIVGGESGNDNGKYRYRECRIEWIESIIQQCKEAGVPVFVKQLGTHLAKELNLSDRHGGNIEEWPEHLRIREFPKTTVPCY